MDTITKPSKEQVRTFMEQRRHTPAPPPSIAEIRRQLGWHLADARPLHAR